MFTQHFVGCTTGGKTVPGNQDIHETPLLKLVNMLTLTSYKERQYLG